MNLQAFIQFGMKGGNELLTLAGSHNLTIYLRQNLGISPHLFNIRGTDEVIGMLPSMPFIGASM